MIQQRLLALLYLTAVVARAFVAIPTTTQRPTLVRSISQGSLVITHARLSAVPPAAASSAPPPPPPPPPPTFMKHNIKTTLMGKIWPVLVKLHITPAKLQEIWRALKTLVQPQDFVFLSVVALIAFYHVESKKQKPAKLSSNFRTFLQKVWVVEAVQSLAQVALSAYVVDIVCLILRVQGFAFPHIWDLPRVYAKIAFSSWFLQRFLKLKQQGLRRFLGNMNSGQLELIDKALNGVSVLLMALLVSDWLSVEMGFALKGVVTLGSMWTLAFTLASKDLVSQLVSGLFLHAGNKMQRGEKVKFGDGSSGKVMRIGWTETVLRGSDNTITSIPNAKLVNEKVVNFSRVKVSQVQQKLRFHYQDIDELPAVLESIRAEIKASCPNLVVDGSRPFRVYFTDYAENSLEVMVDTHFYISPTSDEYWSNRQEVLMAINRAVKSHNIQYAYSTSDPQESTKLPPPRANDDEDEDDAADDDEWSLLTTTTTRTNGDDGDDLTVP